jgi:hypothetical protein
METNMHEHYLHEQTYTSSSPRRDILSLADMRYRNVCRADVLMPALKKWPHLWQPSFSAAGHCMKTTLSRRLSKGLAISFCTILDVEVN